MDESIGFTQKMTMFFYWFLALFSAFNDDLRMFAVERWSRLTDMITSGTEFSSKNTADNYENIDEKDMSECQRYLRSYDDERCGLEGDVESDSASDSDSTDLDKAYNSSEDRQKTTTGAANSNGGWNEFPDISQWTDHALQVSDRDYEQVCARRHSMGQSVRSMCNMNYKMQIKAEGKGCSKKDMTCLKYETRLFNNTKGGSNAEESKSCTTVEEANVLANPAPTTCDQNCLKKTETIHTQANVMLEDVLKKFDDVVAESTKARFVSENSLQQADCCAMRSVNDTDDCKSFDSCEIKPATHDDNAADGFLLDRDINPADTENICQLRHSRKLVTDLDQNTEDVPSLSPLQEKSKIFAHKIIPTIIVSEPEEDLANCNKCSEALEDCEEQVTEMELIVTTPIDSDKNASKQMKSRRSLNQHEKGKGEENEHKSCKSISKDKPKSGGTLKRILRKLKRSNSGVKKEK